MLYAFLCLSPLYSSLLVYMYMYIQVVVPSAIYFLMPLTIVYTVFVHVHVCSWLCVYCLSEFFPSYSYVRLVCYTHVHVFPCMHTQTGDGVGTVVPLRNTHPLIRLIWICLVGRLYREYVYKCVYVRVFRWRIDVHVDVHVCTYVFRWKIDIIKARQGKWRHSRQTGNFRESS